MPITINEPETDKDFNSLIAGAPKDSLVVIYFHTPWAEPCRQMSQIFSAVASSLPDTAKAIFIALDAEGFSDISEKYEVAVVPYVGFYKEGKRVDSVSGVVTAKEFKARVDGLLESGTHGTALPPPQKVDPQTAGNGEGAITSTEQPEEEEDLNERLAKLVNAAPVMLFMKGTPATPRCGFSRQIVTLLRERGVRYGFFNILADEDVRQGLKTFSDWPTYPQLYLNGELIGGLDIVREEMENDPNFLKDAGGAPTTA